MDDVDSRLQQHWAHMLGCGPEAFEGPGPVLGKRPVAAVAAVFRVGSATVVRLPGGPRQGRRPEDLEGLTARAEEESSGKVEVLYFYLLESPSLPPTDLELRPLGKSDRRALTHFRRACPVADRRLCDIRPSHDLLLGAWDGGELVAVASLLELGRGIGDLGILSHPAHRRRGLARLLVAHLADRTLRRGLLPQYCTLASNRASAAVARSLGFELRAREVLLPLRDVAS